MTANPFKASRYGDTQCYHQTAEDRIRAVLDFDRAVCTAALLLPDLQKTVATAVQRRLRYLDKVAAILEFEDHGQDFLRWELDAKGRVIGCGPFQAFSWVGCQVLVFEKLKAGDSLFYERRSKSGGCSGGSIRYPLAKVTLINPLEHQEQT